MLLNDFFDILLVQFIMAYFYIDSLPRITYMPLVMRIGLVILMITFPQQPTLFILAIIPSHGAHVSKRLEPDHPRKLNTVL